MRKHYLKQQINNSCSHNQNESNRLFHLNGLDLKKISPLIMLINITSAFAGNMGPVYPPFYSIELAEMFCPAPSMLIYVPNIKIVRGYTRFEFSSTSRGGDMEPQNITPNGMIAGALFSNESGRYGYIYDHVITCFYSYQAIGNLKYDLEMRGGYLD
jgi:hypothetical protein